MKAQLTHLINYYRWVTAICCSPLHSHLISGGDDGIIILWDVGVDADVSDKRGTARAKLLGTQVVGALLASLVVSLLYSLF